MFCVRCGCNLPDNAVFCMKCGNRTSQVSEAPKTRYFLVLSQRGVVQLTARTNDKTLAMLIYDKWKGVARFPHLVNQVSREDWIATNYIADKFRDAIMMKEAELNSMHRWIKDYAMMNGWTLTESLESGTLDRDCTFVISK